MLPLLLITAILSTLALAILSAGRRRPDPAPRPGSRPEGISLIIAAHNEEANLRRHLPTWLAQQHQGPWELIIALDRCTDGSAAFLADAASQHPRIRTVAISATPPGWAPKKHALTQAIAQARHEHLAFTDADCALEPQWLSAIHTAFQRGASLILGAGPLRRRPGLLNALARFETWMTAQLYLGLAGWGLPYMAVGRSLAYTRTFWQQAGRFDAHSHRLSGDDDLLVNAARHTQRPARLQQPGTFALSDAPPTWRAWIRQKLRHHSAAPAYTTRSKTILGAIHILSLLFYLSLVLALLCSPDPEWAAVIWGCRAASNAILMALVPWPDRNDLILLSPVLELLYLVYLIVMGPAGMILPPKWKGK